MTVVFCNVWEPGFIETALKTAAQNCPECRVALLRCDRSSVGWSDEYDITESMESAFAKLDESPEKLFGPNPAPFEKICVARWKIIADWMEENAVEEVTALDSDVLLFENPFTTPHYQPGQLHVSDNHFDGGISAGCSIISKAHALAAWDRSLSVLASLDVDGSFNDLAVWRLISRSREFVDLHKIINGVAWDHHMGCVKDEGGWEEDPEFMGYKNIQWIDQKPHCLHVPSGELVRLVNLHCWGDAEPNMPEYAKLGGVYL